MHGRQQDNVDDKGNIIRFYNETKGGVDTLDKLVRTYRATRKCARWSYGIVMTLADVAVVASMKLMVKENKHYEYKRELAYQLCDNLNKKRMTIPHLRSGVRSAIELLNYKFPKPSTRSNEESKRLIGRCIFCARDQDRKSRRKCSSCEKFVCPEHSFALKYVVCPNCYAT